MIMFILQCIYFFLPAYIANTAPSIFKRLNFLAYPIDFGKSYRGKRIFGTNKTLRGLVIGMIFGILTFILQQYLYSNFAFFQQISLIDYSNTSLLLGVLLSFGALLGDMIESFFKRQKGVAPGKPWIPFDQLDFVVGALLLSLPIVILEWKVYLVIVLASFLLHIAANHTGYYLKIQKNKW